MGRKGWAITIVTSLIVIMVVLLAVRSEEFSELGGSTSGDKKWREQVVSGAGRDKVLQLNVEGAIVEKKGGFTGGAVSGDIISQLEQAKEDDRIKAIVLRVNSPGGGVVPSDEIHNKIVEVKEKGKPIIVSMGGVAASGGYYISAPADYIFANSLTITGSLGVLISVPNYQKAADWIGYQEYTFTSGEFKDIGNTLREMSQKEKDIFQTLVDESYQRFVDVIEQGRKLPRDKVLSAADGRVYSGRQAKELGLIDEFGTLEDAIQYAKKKAGLEEAKVVTYSSSGSFLSLFSEVSTSIPAAEQILNQVMPEAEGPQLMYLYR
jgi:protease IV